MVAHRFDGKKDGISTRFSSTNQPKNRRKPKLFTILKKEYGINIDTSSMDALSREQICDVLKLVLTGDPRNNMIINSKISDQLKKLKNDIAAGRDPGKLEAGKQIWQLLLSLNSSVAKEANYGKSDTIRWMIEYLYGKPTQPLENNITDNRISDDDLSEEELQAQIDQIDQCLNT
jgi:hypothetical protein